MKLIFVAGPYRSKDGEEGIKQNLYQAERATYELWAGGFAAISSHTNTPAHFMSAADYEDFARGYLAIMLKCDAVVFLPGWEESTGCQGEMKAAKENDLDIYFWPQQKEELLRGHP